MYDDLEIKVNGRFLCQVTASDIKFQIFGHGTDWITLYLGTKGKYGWPHVVTVGKFGNVMCQVKYHGGCQRMPMAEAWDWIVKLHNESK